jgi:hypothetical protein
MIIELSSIIFFIIVVEPLGTIKVLIGMRLTLVFGNPTIQCMELKV